MSKMALAAYQGGAKGIRANSVEDIKAIQQEVNLPIIGIIKKDYPGSDIYITTTMDEVDALVAANVEIIAMDATSRLRPNQTTLATNVIKLRTEWHSRVILQIYPLAFFYYFSKKSIDIATIVCGLLSIFY